METCIECYSSDLDELETDPDCDGCSLMECGDCGVQFERAEMVGVDHYEDCPAARQREADRG